MNFNNQDSLKSFSSSELLLGFGRLVQTERKITRQILEYIVEIEARKVYLDKYSDLHTFLVKEHGYSGSAAKRRVASAKLLRDVPEVSKKIQEGALTLSQLCQLQETIRLVQKTEDRIVGAEEKKELLSKMEYTTQKTTELILAQEFSLPVPTYDKEQIHKDESVTLTITFTKEQMALLRQAQDLIAHCVPEKKWASVLTHLAQKEINRRTKIKRPNSVSDKKMTSEIQPVAVLQRRTIRPNVRKFVFNKDKYCQFKNPHTGEICGSTRFLQIDHIQPIWAGGSNDPRNLQVLCAQHNQLKYRKEVGINAMAKTFLR